MTGPGNIASPELVQGFFFWHVLVTRGTISLQLVAVYFDQDPPLWLPTQPCCLHHGWEPEICQAKPTGDDRGTHPGLWEVGSDTPMVPRFGNQSSHCLCIQVCHNQCYFTTGFFTDFRRTPGNLNSINYLKIKVFLLKIKIFLLNWR